MSSDNAETVFKVSNVSKCFEMYERPIYRLLQTFWPGRKKFYREFWALRNMNFEVRRGECLGIIGRNGAGKSTLLQILTGTLTPTEGSIYSKGRIAALLELGSGFNPEFTGRENVYLNAAILGLTKKETDERFSDILDFADIGDFIDQPVKSYSSGMMMRLAFAVIAHVDADVMIVDEALSVGDAFFVQKCMRFMRKFMKEHTVIFVSHDTGAVADFCTRAILLEHGEITLDSDTKTVLKKYSELFLASQIDMNKELIEGRINNDAEIEYTGIADYADMRRDYLINTNLRNDISINVFDRTGKTSVGMNGAEIVSVVLYDSKWHPLNGVIGGEKVILELLAVAKKDLKNPIMGFELKNPKGLNLFAENTAFLTQAETMYVKSGQKIRARFFFRLPILPAGDYSITVAIAEGTYSQHVQHHYIHDALILESSRSICYGAVGIPMEDIKLEILN